uniref:Movement protein TGBp3 n=1 Tax=Allexivirus sigmamedicagonis TaxID=1985968 RepID=A0A6M3RFP5_9VIRU|nr:putative triple gene block protein 3 [Alfalfa virus S]
MQAPELVHTHASTSCQQSPWYSSPWALLLVSGLSALLVLAAADYFNSLPGSHSCLLTITGHSVSVSGCENHDVPAIIQSFAWSGHAFNRQLPGVIHSD